MSSLLSHKSIRVTKPTRGHDVDPKTGELRPSDVLIDRAQQYKHITKSLLHYYKGQSAIEATTAKATMALCGEIQVPFHEGNQFLGTGGWQEVLYEVRDKTKILSEHHSALSTTLDKTVVKELEGVRSELKAHIAAIEKEAGVLATEVDKERTTSASHLTQLQTGIDTFENSSEHMLPQHDPYLSHALTSQQLKKQVHKENDLQAALIRFQQQQPAFEEGIVKSIQSACRLYDEAKATKTADIQATQKEIAAALQRVSPLTEYEFYSQKEGAIIDPNSPTRSVDAITFPGLDHASVVPIKEGHLERKKRFTKSYKENYYVLTPSGYLHERKSNDDTNAIMPNFSLFLPECSLGPPAKPDAKSHKFHVEGNKAVKSSFEGKMKSGLRFGGKEIAYSFRARTHAEMLAWWEQMDKLSRDTKAPVESSNKSTVTPVAAAVANVGFATPTTTATAPEHTIAAGGLAAGAESSTNGHATTEAAEEEEDEEGGSSAEEEEEELARTAPSTPAVFNGVATSPLDEAGEKATGVAETLPTYTGDGTSAPEKAALSEKGHAPALGATASTST